jgi:hypothetical protein
VVEKCWRTLRGNYRRALKKIKDWTKQPSGSGRQQKTKPKPYKYAGEMSFLADIFEIEETDDSITVLHPSTQQCSDDENLLQVWNEIDYFLMNKYRTRK